MTATPKRDALADIIGDAYDISDSNPKCRAMVSAAVTDAILGNPAAVIAALEEAGALALVETHTYDTTGCGVHRAKPGCLTSGHCEPMLRVVAGEDR